MAPGPRRPFTRDQEVGEGGYLDVVDLLASHGLDPSECVFVLSCF